MTLSLQIIGAWVGLSMTAGPLATWLFFRGRRQAEAAFDNWIAAHPDLPSTAMPVRIAAAYFQVPHSELGQDYCQELIMYSKNFGSAPNFLGSREND